MYIPRLLYHLRIRVFSVINIQCSTQTFIWEWYTICIVIPWCITNVQSYIIQNFVAMLCKIALNVFSSASLSKFRVSMYLNVFSWFILLRTFWTPAIELSYPVYERGGQISSHSMLRMVRLLYLVNSILPVFKMPTHLAQLAMQNMPMVRVALILILIYCIHIVT